MLGRRKKNLSGSKKRMDFEVKTNVTRFNFFGRAVMTVEV